MNLSTLKETYSLYFSEGPSLHRYEIILSSSSNEETMVNTTKFHSFLIVIGYAHESLFESTLLVSMFLKNQFFFSFIFCPSYLL